MGNLFTKLYFKLLTREEKVLCCGETPAAFRCRYTETTSATKSEEIEQIFLLLKKHQYSSAFSRGECITSWFACEKCINEENKKYFTNIPEGWNERIGIFTLYEPINL